MLEVMFLPSWGSNLGVELHVFAFLWVKPGCWITCFCLLVGQTWVFGHMLCLLGVKPGCWITCFCLLVGQTWVLDHMILPSWGSNLSVGTHVFVFMGVKSWWWNMFFPSCRLQFRYLMSALICRYVCLYVLLNEHEPLKQGIKLHT